jgi:DNA-directed RNA polymerase specialized sigma24 family protein
VEVDLHGTTLSELISDKLRGKIRTLKNPNNAAWRECLERWCNTVATRLCLNIIRHSDVERRHVDAVRHEHTLRIRHGKRIIALYSPAMSQEDEVEQKEREAAQSGLRLMVREALDSLTPEPGSFTSQLADNEGGPLFNARLRKADEFFNAAQQARLTELMRLRSERTLSSEEGQELESLIEAELDGARLRAEAEVRWRLQKEIASILSGLTEQERAITHLWAEGLSLSEIADESNAPLATVTGTLKKMSGRLQESLYATHKEKSPYRRESLSEAEEKSA